MKIVAGETEIQVLSAFEDFLYEQDQKRPSLRIRLSRALTAEEDAVLNGQPLTLVDDAGAQLGTFEGYGTLHECTLTLLKETQSAQEVTALKQKVREMEMALRAAGIDTDALIQAQSQAQKSEKEAIL